MSYFHQQNQPHQRSPQYHQLPPSMINAMRAQQRSPTSPYTNTAATPTTSHQQRQLRYQQQQQQQSPHNNNYYSMQQYAAQQSYQQAQPQPPLSLDMHSNTTRSPYPQTQTQPATQTQIQIQPRSPSPSSTPNPIHTHATMNKSAPKVPVPAPVYSSSNDSNHEQHTPQSQRSRFSPPIDAFPDTLPVLDEQNDHSFNMIHPPLITNYSSAESKSKSKREADEVEEEEEEEDAEPIPSDQKLSSSSSSDSLHRLIERDTETASERAFLHQLSQIVLDETNQTNEKIVSDLTEIDEQMQLETTKTRSSHISRSSSHPLQINMKAPLISSLVTRYKKSGSASIGTSPLTSPIVSSSHMMASPPRIKMPNAHNMISYSSTTTTPVTGAAADVSSPVTPNRHSNNGYSFYQGMHHHRVPLSVTTTPNSYQYRQRNTNFSHISYPNTQNVSQTQSNRATHGQPAQFHQYPQTPNNQSSSHHFQYRAQSQGTQHHLPLAQSTKLYTSTSSNSYCNLMGSQTPMPHVNRLRSKSAASANNISMTGSPQFHSTALHHGSMTPQHHNTNNRNRRHSLYDHSYNNNSNYFNKHSRTEKIYNLLQQHGNCMKLSQFTMLYPQQFHEMLPASNRDNNLLKYLVQLPRILVIKCLSGEDIMIFYCETSSHRTVIDILRHSQELFEKEHANDSSQIYKGMEIEQFTLRLAEKLSIASLSDCNIVDFLERWRVVELVDNKYVRLMPMGSCTVFLGNLNPSKWNENKVRNVLTQINPSWYNLRIRLNQTNYGLLNAFVDFKSMKQAQSAIGLIKNHLSLFESNNNNYDQQLMMQQQQQQYLQQQQLKQKQMAQNQNLNLPASPQHGTGIRVEIEQASAHKNHTTNNNHTPHNNNNYHTRNTAKTDKNKFDNNNMNSFARITTNIYQLIRDEHEGQMLMSCIAAEYKNKFAQTLEFDGNPKYFVKMERLLLLNCLGSDDVMIFFTPEPAYKLVVSILKQNPCGLTVEQFKSDLEGRMKMSLVGCDFNDFLMRWRFLSIRERETTVNGSTKKEKMVLFTPHSGSTVFFGNLNVECTESDIYSDLEAADTAWKHSSVRLKLGKGFAYAFVDFPTRQDAMKAVQFFDGKQAFKSKYVSADIEAIEQRKRHHNGQNNKNKLQRNQNKNQRDRSYSNGNSPNQNMRGYNNQNNRGRNNNSGHNGRSGSKANKTTVYLGNLRDDVTKNDIQNELRNFNACWNHLTIRLNLRSGWSHAFVDFELSQEARKLINAWNNRPNPLTCTRLRCEISKRQM